MVRVEKTVFISYRRTNAAWALAIYQHLTHNGFDVFFDYTGISSGDFSQVILENVRSRAHFLILLTPSAVERCNEPGDWLRREIEEAIESRRNLVPLLLDSFDFNSPACNSNLTGKLSNLRTYNGLGLSVEYFEAAMEKLRTRFLNLPLESVIHPLVGVAAELASVQRQAASSAPPVESIELTAQDFFEKGLLASDPNESIRQYNQALAKNPLFAPAVLNRGNARARLNDLVGASADFEAAIALSPKDPLAYYNRSIARLKTGLVAGALEDSNFAIELAPNFPLAHQHRSAIRFSMDDIDGAIEDADTAIRLDPRFAKAFNSRGVSRARKGDYANAILDLTEAIRLDPGLTVATDNRAHAYFELGFFELALEDCNHVLRVAPTSAAAHHAHGLVLQGMGDQPAAARSFQEAHRLNPSEYPPSKFSSNGGRSRD
jgi:tetratricopeptide (TPR) repeat protein